MGIAAQKTRRKLPRKVKAASARAVRWSYYDGWNDCEKQAAITELAELTGMAAHYEREQR